MPPRYEVIMHPDRQDCHRQRLSLPDCQEVVMKPRSALICSAEAASLPHTVDTLRFADSALADIIGWQS